MQIRQSSAVLGAGNESDGSYSPYSRVWHQRLLLPRGGQRNLYLAKGGDQYRHFLRACCVPTWVLRRPVGLAVSPSLWLADGWAAQAWILAQSIHAYLGCSAATSVALKSSPDRPVSESKVEDVHGDHQPCPLITTVWLAHPRLLFMSILVSIFPVLYVCVCSGELVPRSTCDVRWKPQASVSLPFFLFERGFLMTHHHTHQASWPVSFQESCLSLSLISPQKCYGNRCVPLHLALLGFWGSNSGSHLCMASALYLLSHLSCRETIWHIH